MVIRDQFLQNVKIRIPRGESIYRSIPLAQVRDGEKLSGNHISTQRDESVNTGIHKWRTTAVSQSLNLWYNFCWWCNGVTYPLPTNICFYQWWMQLRSSRAKSPEKAMLLSINILLRGKLEFSYWQKNWSWQLQGGRWGTKHWPSLSPEIPQYTLPLNF